MFIKDVVIAVQAIRNAKGDDEIAHGMEDELHQSVLEAIATDSCENPQECAREALKTRDIDFARWCA